MATAALVCTGCHNHGEEHHEDEHAHSHSSVQVVTCAEGVELFAESAEIEKGEECLLTAYFTSLDTFKPCSGTEAELVFAGIDGEKAVHGEYVRPGVFHFEFVPGADKGVLKRITFGGREFDCSNASHTHFPTANVVSFNREQSWMVDFATQRATLEKLGNVINTVGLVSSTQTEERTVVARTGGVVGLAGRYVLPGMPVRKGEALFHISTDGMSDSNMEVRFATAKAEYERTEDEYERKLSLSEDNIVSKAELAQAKSAYDAAKAEYDNLAKYFQNGAFSAISDIDGYIDEVYVSNGDYVEAGQKLACVSHYSRYQVTAKVPSKYASELNHIEDAVFTDAAGNIFRIRDIDGHLIAAGRSVSIENPLIPVTFEVGGKLGVVPGSFVDMRIVTKSADPVLTTDSRAIVEESGNFFVYKQLNPELYQKVQVSIGATDGLRTVINSGLQEGDIIVSKGAVILKLAQAAGTLDAHSGHVH